MERATPSDMMPKRDQERDMDLDKKIEALRRKNEALMKRYKEVEEDRKRAEEEGMALQSRKGKADDLTITISKSTSDNRVVVTKPFSNVPPAGRGQQEAEPDGGEDGASQGAGRGHRMQLMVTMAGKKGKRTVSERPEKRPSSADVESSADDGQVKRGESAGRGKQPPHVTKRDTAAQGQVKGQRHAEEPHSVTEQCQGPEAPRPTIDLSIPTSKEEQEEYLRWKREREQIDRERVARHKNAKGQWRRAWDMDKADNMFSDKSLADRDWGPSNRRGRNARKGQPRAGESRGHEKRGKDKGGENVQVMSSKAKGIDRLTGRARRWEVNEEGVNLETPDTLEEFLEELDALVEDQRDQGSNLNPSPRPVSVSAPEEVAPVSAAIPREGSPNQGKAKASSPQGSDRKVHFSDELVHGGQKRQTTGSQDSASTGDRSLSANKDSSPEENQGPQRGQPHESAKGEDGGPREKGSGPTASQSECTGRDSNLPIAPSSSPPETAVQPAELAKCNASNTNAAELIDSGLSVLSLASGETRPTLSTRSDKARDHGRIV